MTHKGSLTSRALCKSSRTTIYKLCFQNKQMLRHAWYLWYALTITHCWVINKDKESTLIIWMNNDKNLCLTWPPTSCNRAVLTGNCSISVLMAVWSKGQALRCNLFRHILQTVCPQPKLMGRRTVSSNVCVQIGHSRNSVHCGACTGMVICWWDGCVKR